MIPAFNAFKIPDNTPTTWLILSFGNAVHTASRSIWLARMCWFLGAGPVFDCVAAAVTDTLVRNVVITDVNEYRLELAREMGITVRLTSPKKISMT